MIFDTLENLPKYIPFVDGLEKVLYCLQNDNLAEKAPGSYTTDDKRVRYNIGEYDTSAEGKRFEKHRLDTDVQVVLKGKEKMDFTFNPSCGAYGDYDEQKDVELADGKSLLSLEASTKDFVIFFPGEPHKPGLPAGSSEKVKKVIFKIRN
ncbi:YhcH/YjgK/YiaL family protein [Treponema sp. OMZ 840]|uniref:YhcH/YjgK/YiaL family protein n=1 Tax=Treponema sp. OMZ 840 TaxID=244313 RepID=UPI003D8DA1BB